MSSLAPPPSAQATGSQAPPAVVTGPAAITHSTPASGVDQPTGWEDLYRAHVGPLYRYVYARTGNRADAEDLTSQVFLQAFPRLGWRSTPEMHSYLVATARAVLADHWRRHHGAELDELPFDLAASGASSDEDGSDASPSRTAHLLSRLPDRYRSVLELRFLQGCSVRETARIMGVSVANAKVIQLRALRLAAQL